MISVMDSFFEMFGLNIDIETITVAGFFVWFVKVCLSVYVLKWFCDLVDTWSKILMGKGGF